MSKALELALAPVAVAMHAALRPLLSGSFLAGLMYGPLPVRIALENLLRRQSVVTKETSIKVLSVLFVLGLLRKANGALNVCASNSWRVTAAKGWDWDKEIAVVTGGCSGIGKAITLGLARLGVRVAVIDIQELPPDLKTNELVSYFHCDVASAADVCQAADAIRRALGHPSILVNNAGIGVFHSIIDTPIESLHKIFGVNLLSLWSTTQAFLPHMTSTNKGHIVTMASMSSFASVPGMVDYAATKAGALAFHEGLTAELKLIHKAPSVLTTIIHPNWVRTPLVEKHAKRIERKVGPMLTADEVADATVKQIFSCRGGQLIIPKKYTVATGIRGWATWIQVLLRDGLAKTIVPADAVMEAR